MPLLVSDHDLLFYEEIWLILVLTPVKKTFSAGFFFFWNFFQMVAKLQADCAVISVWRYKYFDYNIQLYESICGCY